MHGMLASPYLRLAQRSESKCKWLHPCFNKRDTFKYTHIISMHKHNSLLILYLLRNSGMLIDFNKQML